MMSLVNLESPVACLGTKDALENDLTNWVVGLMQVRISN